MDRSHSDEDAATQNLSGFQTLCEALERNDPTVTSVGSDRSHMPFPHGYGHRLGTALRGNTIVSEISLPLPFLLSGADREAGTTSSAKPLLLWIQSSASLRKVMLSSTVYSVGEDGNQSFRYPPAEGYQPVETIQRQLLEAMSKNPAISGFESNLDLRLRDLTRYLVSKPSLESLILHSFHPPTPRSDSAEDLEAAALAIAALPALQVLSLESENSLLRHLQSNPTLSELHLDFSRRDSSVALLTNVLQTCAQLKSVSLDYLSLNKEGCTLLTSALLGNSSITQVNLHWCSLTEAAKKVFLDFMHSNEESQQHVRELGLSLCSLGPSSNESVAVELANMICNSLLHCVSLDHFTMTTDYENENGLNEFFAVLTANTNDVRLRELYLDDASPNMMRAAAIFLPTSVHLRSFGAAWDDSGLSEWVLPVEFLSGLRSNASLHSVEIRSMDPSLPSERVTRMMDAICTRNRVLPELLQTTSFEGDKKSNRTLAADNGTPTTSSTPSPPPPPPPPPCNQFATLCELSMQAPRMAPNSLLIGLLAADESSNSLGPLTVGKCGKRRRASEADEST